MLCGISRTIIFCKNVLLMNVLQNIPGFFLFGSFRPNREFSFIWRRHHYRRRAINFDLCLALMAIEQTGFFSEPQLLWQGYPFIMSSPRTRETNAHRWAFGSGAVTTCIYYAKYSDMVVYQYIIHCALFLFPNKKLFIWSRLQFPTSSWISPQSVPQT